MSRARIFEEARRDFEHFAQTAGSSGGEDPDQYLDNWFADWLQYGNGVEHTGRNYETYLRTCLHLADMVMQGKVKLDFRGTKEDNWEDAFPRHVAGIESPDDPAHYDDRAVYEAAAIRWENQGRGMLVREHGV